MGITWRVFGSEAREERQYEYVQDGYISLYKDQMESGLRYPFHPFTTEVLNLYYIIVS